ncbi:DNA binding protein [Bacillus phage G]|uniref:Gp346 n=1 Tax=Bacillus phage G TaxID=2884420 RepID=G3MA87_9CAUD|nr:DNA binding protein [Bacillus phage G]AEO93605.1 gp346 [Bacillus phage G]
MKRLFKKALISLNADDMRLNKDEEVKDEKILNNDVDELEKKPLDLPLPKKDDEISDIEISDEPKFEPPTFEQPQVTPESVNNEFGVESPGMGIDLVSLDQGLLNDLASLQVLYQQTKLFHWIFNGENYIATHRFLDEVADSLLEEIDLYAERLVYLNIDPVADMTQITTMSYVQFVQMNQNFKFSNLLMILDNGLSQIIDSMKDNSIRAGESKDIGTSKMLEDFVYDLEVLQHHIRSFK